MARLLMFLALASSSACGGSSSESPWPVEPLDMEGAPIGENEPVGRAVDTTAVDNYGQGGAASAKETDAELPEEELGPEEALVPEEP